jgi:zinc protease
VDGKADAMNNYFTLTGNPDYFNEDLARYKALSPEDIQSTAQTFLKDDARVILTVVPKPNKESK